jgi:C4-dicarboxylate transporter, DctM subunit
MSGPEIGLYSIVALLILIYSGMHVAIALGMISFVSIWLLRDSPVIASKMVAHAATESIATYTFGVIPLFVLMGFVVASSDMGRDVFDLANRAMHRIRGGLGMATVAAQAVFSAIVGTGIASATVFTRVAIPEMRRHGYSRGFAAGVVAGSSVLGMLIPPSLLLILFGIIAEVSIGKLFLGGILPGILLAILYIILIAFLARKFPDFVGSEAMKNTSSQTFDRLENREILSKGIPVVLLIMIVLGGIYTGVFTPTEAGGVGALGALIIAFAKGKLTGSRIGEILTETGFATASVAFLLMAAHLYASMLALAGLPGLMANYLASSGFGLYGVMFVFIILVLLLGTIIDSASIMLISVPLFLPIMVEFNADLVWWGVITVVAVECGLLTPPFGMAVFIIKSALNDPETTINDIFVGAFPFFLTMLVALALLVAFPIIVLAPTFWL